MTADGEERVTNPGGLAIWLLNPFHFVAGWRSLVTGLAAIAAAGLVGSLSNSHFDGVLDFHTGTVVSPLLAIGEGLIDWLAMGLLLLPAGHLLSGSRVRVVDVLGTQALARTPSLVAALGALLPGYQRYAVHLAEKYLKKGATVELASADPVVFSMVAILALTMVIWMVVLMYRAFAVSCNVKGVKAIISFIVVLVLGEIASKIAIFKLLALSG